MPTRILVEEAENAVSWARALTARDDPQLFVTEWEIPVEAVPEAVIALRKEIVP